MWKDYRRLQWVRFWIGRNGRELSEATATPHPTLSPKGRGSERTRLVCAAWQCDYKSRVCVMMAGL